MHIHIIPGPSSLGTFTKNAWVKKGVNSPSPKRVFPLVPRLGGAGMYWLNHDTNIKEGTVDGRNPANQLIGSLSHDLQILQCFIYTFQVVHYFFPATVPLETMFNSYTVVCSYEGVWVCCDGALVETTCILLNWQIRLKHLKAVLLRVMIIWTE